MALAYCTQSTQPFLSAMLCALGAHVLHECKLSRGRTCKRGLHCRTATLCDCSSIGGDQGRCQRGVAEGFCSGHGQRIRVHCTG